jgi:hypothetical protein
VIFFTETKGSWLGGLRELTRLSLKNLG